MNVLRAVACTLLWALLAACAASTTQPIMPRAASGVRSAAVTPLIYLFDGHVPPTAIDELPSAGGRPVTQIRNGLTEPASAVVDKTGKLYVVNYTGAQFQILEYPSGAAAPAAAITIGIGTPGGVTVSPKGELYVLNQAGPLVKYAAGSTTPAYTTYRGICKPGSPATYALSIDPYDTLYALSMCTKNAVIQEYDNGLPHVSRTIQMPGTELPIGLTADKQGTLYVTYFDTLQSFRLGVAEYARDSTVVSTQFDFGPVPKQASSGTSPVVDEVTGRLYTTYGICTHVAPRPWHCAGYVYGFRRGLKKPVVTLTAPHLRIFSAPVFDASGNLYVESSGPTSPFDSIWRYSATGTGKTRLLRSRLLSLIDIWPDADSPTIVRHSGVTAGFASACQSTPMSQSSPRSFLANERNAMSVSVFTIPSSAATCSVTKSLRCSCSFTRATATRSNGPATE